MTPDESRDAEKAQIVLIDDDGAIESTLQSSTYDLTAWHPDELDDPEFRDFLFAADVVLVDQQLYGDAETQPPLPSDGLSLLAVLQRFVARELPDQLISFALYSGALASLSTLPGETRAHVIARMNGFEWAFGKGETSNVADVITSVRALGLATQAARSELKKTTRAVDRVDAITDLLKLPSGGDWAASGKRQMLSCHPPVSEVVTDTSGGAFLRWLLHRVLPYPTFLYGEAHIAARVGLPLDQVSELLRGELGAILRSSRYVGVLSDFDGDRYWRSGVEAALSELTSGDESDSAVLRDALVNRIPVQLNFVEHPRPVLALDAMYNALNLPQDPKLTVRIQPDDWPAYAEPARVLSELALEDPDIMALVLAADRQRLVGGHQQSGS